MAGKSKKVKADCGEVTSDACLEINPTVSEGEDLIIANARLKEICNKLNRQIAGLRGEITKLQKVIATKNTELEDLRQEYNDLRELYERNERDLTRYKEFVNRPWYKRIFS